jgi:hypothetical protein
LIVPGPTYKSFQRLFWDPSEYLLFIDGTKCELICKAGPVGPVGPRIIVFDNTISLISKSLPILAFCNTCKLFPIPTSFTTIKL